ncbi:uncharacterized protein OCT59_003433 [Rhizophagus irregularis]|uniref:uncharacterized protein n=1 Tax=Rhizophagus irregularis TaxID=588596 RepID=UPI00331E9E40|nr:hypothetical protein OCT59_003433 [Rhizophagus irregularis]
MIFGQNLKLNFLIEVFEHLSSIRLSTFNSVNSVNSGQSQTDKLLSLDIIGNNWNSVINRLSFHTAEQSI